MKKLTASQIITVIVTAVVILTLTLVIIREAGLIGNGAPVQVPTAAAHTSPEPSEEAATQEPAQPTAIRAEEATSTLEQVRVKGILRCGVSPNNLGFSQPVDINKPFGDYIGLEADFCRAIAAAISQPTRPISATFVPVVSTPDAENERFSKLANKDIDVLFAGTTWTAVRDIDISEDDPRYSHLINAKFDFGPVIYHDAQRFLMQITEGVVPTLRDLNGKRVCVEEGTTSEKNLANLSSVRNPETGELLVTNPVTVRAVSEVEGLIAGYTGAGGEKQCDAITADDSELRSILKQLNNPSNVIISQPISREPLAPVVRSDDQQWRDIVSYTIHAIIYANEIGVFQASANTDYTTSVDARVQRLLGKLSPSIGPVLGLEPDFVREVIMKVGNYQEIFNRNMIKVFDSIDATERGPNAVWNEGGDLNSPPF